MSDTPLITGKVNFLKIPGVKLLEKDGRKFLEITEAKLYHGAKGIYLDIVLIPTPGGRFGDYMICQSVTKEERQAGKKGEILGNGDIPEQQSRGGGQRQERSSQRPTSSGSTPADKASDDEIPF
jgi:hypothetical protein